MFPEWLKKAYKKSKNLDEAIDKVIVYVAFNSLDEFVSACMDENGKPKAPDRAALMRARGMLPLNYKNTLNKR